AGRARGVLSGQAGDRGAVRLGPGPTAAAVQGQEWRGRKWIGGQVAAEQRASASRGRAWVAVLLVCVCGLLGPPRERGPARRAPPAVTWRSAPGSCANWG